MSSMLSSNLSGTARASCSTVTPPPRAAAAAGSHAESPRCDARDAMSIIASFSAVKIYVRVEHEVRSKNHRVFAVLPAEFVCVVWIPGQPPRVQEGDHKGRGDPGRQRAMACHSMRPRLKIASSTCESESAREVKTRCILLRTWFREEIIERWRGARGESARGRLRLLIWAVDEGRTRAAG